MDNHHDPALPARPGPAPTPHTDPLPVARPDGRAGPGDRSLAWSNPPTGGLPPLGDPNAPTGPVAASSPPPGGGGFRPGDTARFPVPPGPAGPYDDPAYGAPADGPLYSDPGTAGVPPAWDTTATPEPGAVPGPEYTRGDTAMARSGDDHGSGGGSLRRWVAGGALAAAVLLLVAAIGGEFWVRHRLTSCLADQVSTAAHAPATVSLGGKPLVFTAFDKKVGSLHVETGEATAGGAIGSRYTVDAADIDISNSSDPVAGSLDITFDVGTRTLEHALGGQLGAQITSVTANPAAGTIEYGLLGLANARMRPVLRDGAVVFETQGASILGIQLPPGLVDSIVTSILTPQQELPTGVTATSVSVTDGGVRIKLSGTNVRLAGLGSKSEQASTRGCSVF